MAFLRSGTEREPFFNAPAVVTALIAVLVAAHLARVWLFSGPVSDEIVTNYGFVPLRYAADALEPGSVADRAIPFVSYMFLHADAMHLAINCLWLLAFGPVVARRFGPWLFLLFFAVSGIAAACVQLALEWGEPGITIGASGAISGLMGAGIRMLRPPAAPDADVPGLTPLFSQQVLMFSGMWIVVNLVFGWTGMDFFGGAHAIAWQAHLGGYFTGLLLSGPFDGWARKSSAGRLYGA